MHTLLAAPHGTLSPGDRRIVIAAYLLVTVGVLPLYLFFDPSTECANCPDNVFLIKHSQSVVDVASLVINLIGVVLIGARAPQPHPPLARGHARRAPALHPDVRGGGRADDRADREARAAVGRLGEQRGPTSHSSSRWCPFALVPYLFLGSLVRARLLRAAP